MVKYKKLLTQEVIHADETVVQVLREKNRKPTTESGMQVYCTDKINQYFVIVLSVLRAYF